MSAGDALENIRQRIDAAALRSGRRGEDIRLIAVSKHQPVSAIEKLAACGQQDFGENQVQEAVDKIARLCDQSLEWHFIGHLQSNKARHTGSRFSWIHTLDSLRLARRIAASAEEAGRTIRLLLQVNVSADPAKHGIAPGELFPLVDALLEADLDGIHLCGLMTIGRRAAGESESRTTFSALRSLLEQCQVRFGTSFSELSMGMSDDYEWAVEEGATMLRIGKALFGER